MLEIVQHASFRIDSLALLRRCSRQGRAEQFNTTCSARTRRLVTDSPHKWEVDPCGPSWGFYRSGPRDQRDGFLFSRSHLCLNVVSRDDVADGSQCGRGHLVVGVPGEKRWLRGLLGVQAYAGGARPSLHEQLHEAPADAGVDDGLDLVVGAV